MRKNIALGGISRIPGGATSGDGDLSIAVNVANDGQGLQLLEQPHVLFPLEQGEELLCIHTPEGDEKHYITQLVVGSTAETDASSDSSDSDDPEASPETDEESPEVGESVSEVVEATPVDPYDPIAPSVSSWTQNEATPYPTASSYTPTTIATAVGELFEEKMEAQVADRESDDGGVSRIGSNLDAPSQYGVYLIWRRDDGDGTSTIMQTIDITAYGAVTAIQAIGNTLACNHAGVPQTDDDEMPAAADAELRFYLFKKENDGETLMQYVPLGGRPPFLKIRFGLKSKFKWWPTTESEFKTSDNVKKKYKKYGGITTFNKAYTDTIPVYLGDYDSDDEDKNWWPPVEVVDEIKRQLDAGDSPTWHGQSASAIFEALFGHWQPTYSIEGVESPDGNTNVDGIKNAWTRNILGCYNRFIYEQQKDNKFVFPFYVRYGYEMFDGSVMMHSYPVLMIPNSRGPIFALDGWQGIDAGMKYEGESYEKTLITTHGRTYGFASTLMHQITALTEQEYTRLGYWRDLIQGISIYVTPPLYNYNQGGQVFGWHSMSPTDPSNNNEDPWAKHYTVGKVVYGSNDSSAINGEVKMDYAFANLIQNDKIFKPYGSFTINGTSRSFNSPAYCMTVPQKDDKDIMELHESAGQFFKLATIDFDKVVYYAEHGMNDGEVEIRNKVLNTISARELMPDDSGTHDKISADILYGYNRRLNMAGVKRVISPPLPLVTQWAHDYTSTSNTGFYYGEEVRINNHGKTARMLTYGAQLGVTWPKFIFYPGHDAREVIISRSSGDVTKKYRVKLKEHKFLNGMFWLGDFTNKSDSIEDFPTTDSLTPSSANRIVDEGNKIFTSATDNPFYVPIGNINVIGDGQVRALASATQAMSQGQFGQHPMYAFTSTGVWALTVDNSGGWGTVQPMTRDVIGTNSQPLSLDSTVIFLTERGLLQLAGATVEILSDVLSTTDTALDLNKFSALADAIDTKFGLVQVIPSQTEGEDPTIITTMPTYAHMRTKAVAFTNMHFPMGDANLGYDSDNQRIYVTPHGEDFSWVYNIKSRLWTQATTHLDKQVPSYPELISQQGSDVVLVSVDGGVVSNRYPNGLVVTRPIKFQDMGLLKKWREMILRGQFKNYTLTTPMVMTALWGTRDWNKFALVASSQGSRITRWGGSPYFGHVVLVALHGNNAYNIQVNGIDVDVEEEQINKLR